MLFVCHIKIGGKNTVSEWKTYVAYFSNKIFFIRKHINFFLLLRGDKHFKAFNRKRKENP